MIESLFFFRNEPSNTIIQAQHTKQQIYIYFVYNYVYINIYDLYIYVYEYCSAGRLPPLGRGL